MKREEFVAKFQKKLLAKFNSGFQSWWPNFIFHYSDVTNITSILNSGILYSREQASQKGLMTNDNASDAVIGGTDESLKKYVRFYFGAKTPTQFQNEGIKPKINISNNAHCPVPVFLLFDFVKMLALPDIRFSSGNIAAANAKIYDEISDLESLEFDNIYNRAPLPSDTSKGHIIYCRHAEVLVKDKLEIQEFLKYICVRSEAEREMLLNLMNDKARSLYGSKIKVFTKDGIFYKDRLYVNKVSLNGQVLSVEFANAKNALFDLDTVYTVIDSGVTRVSTHSNMAIPTKLTGSLSEPIGPNGIDFSLSLDKNLVYKGRLLPDTDVPF
ncbi:MAG: DarT ssDNA thymidine ADP-ribosyltransferase family protein [Sulfuricurvum sp.]